MFSPLDSKTWSRLGGAAAAEDRKGLEGAAAAAVGKLWRGVARLRP